MTPKLILLLAAVAGMAPAVIWSMLSLATALFSIVNRPVWLTFQFFSKEGHTELYRYHQLPFLTSFCILVGAILLICGIATIPRA